MSGIGEINLAKTQSRAGSSSRNNSSQLHERLTRLIFFLIRHFRLSKAQILVEPANT